MEFIVIKNKFQQLRLMKMGAAIYEWLAFSDKTSIVMNNDDLEVYKDSKAGYFGSTIGRVANRINNATFELDGVKYQLPKNNLNKHNLHGGSYGFDLHQFEVVEKTETKVVFKTISPDMENGFPGEVELFVTYELVDNVMLMSYKATTNKPTIINITNHAHFNLGDETILNHHLEMNADRILEVDNELIPTGKFLSLDKSVLDFRSEKLIKEAIDPLKGSLTNGIDHAFLFEEKSKGQIKLSFKNKALLIETSYPGTQIYSMNKQFMQKRVGGSVIPVWGALAFECQLEPDAINHPHFSNTILRPGKVYQHYIKYTLKEE